MIQRIQTLYLLVVALLTGATLLLPLAWFGSGAETFTLHAFALKDGAGEAVHSTPYMGALLAAATLLPLATIFLFKRRMLQLRLPELPGLRRYGVPYAGDAARHRAACGLPAVRLPGGPCDPARRIAGAFARPDPLTRLTRSCGRSSSGGGRERTSAAHCLRSAAPSGAAGMRVPISDAPTQRVANRPVRRTKRGRYVLSVRGKILTLHRISPFRLGIVRGARAKRTIFN